MKKVMIFGTFDYLHAGHESLFKQAKLLGDYLIVIVARDKTVKKVKGKYPDHCEQERVNLVKKEPLVNLAILGNHDDKYKVIKKYRPDIIALGYDQFVFTYRLKKFLIDENMDAEILRLKAYEPEMYKSSIVKHSSHRKGNDFKSEPAD